MNKTERVLRFIGRSKTGRKFSEIQRYVVVELNGLEWNRSRRGYWCDHLLGCGEYGPGVLRRLCRKGPDGRWRLNERVNGKIVQNKDPWIGTIYEGVDG